MKLHASRMSVLIAGLAVVVLVVVGVVFLPAAERSVTTSPRPVVGYVGDSLTVAGMSEGLQASMEALGYDTSSLRIDGLVGRSIVDGQPPYLPSSQEVVTRWRQEGFHPNVWLIALMSNDFGKTKDELKIAIGTLLDVIDDEPVTKVLWVGPVVMPGSQLQSQVDENMYPALTEVMTERAGSVQIEVLDLQSAIRGQHVADEERTLWTDDRHMTPTGYRLRNELIVEFCRTHQ